MGSHLAIRLMGEFEIAFDGSPCRAVNTARLQSLTAFLITHRAAPQLRQTVSFLFWPDSSERQALNNLRTLLYHLRRALPNARSYIDADAVTVRWRSESEFSLDVAELEAALGAGAIGRAMELYRGDFLPGCYDDWAIDERARLRRAYAEALQRHAVIAEQQGAYACAIRLAACLLAYDPASEETCRQLMRLYAANGDRAAALRAYAQCAETMRREFGAEPSRETREAYGRILCG